MGECLLITDHIKDMKSIWKLAVLCQVNQFLKLSNLLCYFILFSGLNSLIQFNSEVLY